MHGTHEGTKWSAGRGMKWRPGESPQVWVCYNTRVRGAHKAVVQARMVGRAAAAKWPTTANCALVHEASPAQAASHACCRCPAPLCTLCTLWSACDPAVHLPDRQVDHVAVNLLKRHCTGRRATGRRQATTQGKSSETSSRRGKQAPRAQLQLGPG